MDNPHRIADDLQYFKPNKINRLINTQKFFDLLSDGKISLGAILPCLLNTSLGWVVGGKIYEPHKDSGFYLQAGKFSQATAILGNQRFFQPVTGLYEDARGTGVRGALRSTRQTCEVWTSAGAFAI